MHLVHSLNIGGLENGAINLVNHMDASAFRHSICCLTTSGDLAKRLARPEAVPIWQMGQRPGNDFRLPFRLAKLFKDQAVDIIHTGNWGTFFDGVIGAKLAHRKIKLFHGFRGLNIEDLNGLKRRRKITQTILARLTNKLVVLSPTLKEYYCQLFRLPESKIEIITNGVDLDRFRPLVNESWRKSKRAEIGLKTDDLVIGNVARLDPVKEHKSLISAIALLKDQIPTAILLIVGDGPTREHLKALTQSLGLESVVRFLGFRDDVADLLRIMDVYVQPSLWEGVSNTILEAMATGLPVIATRVGGNPDLVIDAETGFLVPASQPAEIARRIIVLAKSPELAHSLGRAARRQAEESFSVERMIKAYENLCYELMGN